MPNKAKSRQDVSWSRNLSVPRSANELRMRTCCRSYHFLFPFETETSLLLNMVLQTNDSNGISAQTLTLQALKQNAQRWMS